MIRIAIFASGRGSNAKNLITSEIPGASIVLLITDRLCNALSIGSEHAIETKTFIPKSYRSREEMEKDMAKTLEAHNIHLIVLAGYMRLFSPWFIHRFRGRIINIHPSLLPLYKGKHAMEQALLDGKKLYGVTVHHVNEGMDEGEVIAQRRVYYDGEVLEELEQLIHETEYELYPQVIRTICKEGKIG